MLKMDAKSRWQMLHSGRVDEEKTSSTSGIAAWKNLVRSAHIPVPVQVHAAVPAPVSSHPQLRPVQLFEASEGLSVSRPPADQSESVPIPVPIAVSAEDISFFGPQPSAASCTTTGTASGTSMRKKAASGTYYQYDADAMARALIDKHDSALLKARNVPREDRYTDVEIAEMRNVPRTTLASIYELTQVQTILKSQKSLHDIYNDIVELLYHRRARGDHLRTLTKEQEKALAKEITDAALYVKIHMCKHVHTNLYVYPCRQRVPIDCSALRFRVSEISRGPLPSPHYIREFLSRHGFTLRRLQLKSRYRLDDRTENVKTFFVNWAKTVETYKVEARNVFFCDETSLSEIASQNYVIVPKFLKHAEATHSGYSQNITAMATASAAGSHMPPFLVVSGMGDMSKPSTRDRWTKTLSDWPGLTIAFNGTGTCSMTINIFREYASFLRKHCGLLPDEWIFLVLDGCSVHMDLANLLHFLNKKIMLIFLVPWTSSILQVSVSAQSLMINEIILTSVHVSADSRRGFFLTFQTESRKPM